MSGEEVTERPDGGNAAVLEKVSKVYRMGEVEVYALHEMDLSLKRGEFVAVLGPSGSGKTTLLNMLGGLDVPTSGRVIVDGEEITGYRQSRLAYFRREKVGFVFQFFNLIPTLTARENVQYAIELASRDRKAPSRTAPQLLEMVGLKDRAEHFPSQLSGGEQQRVAVARAIAKDPALILGDEPTGNLDFRMGKLVLKTLKEMNVREGRTVVVVTHNQPISRVADRVLHIRDGKIHEEEIIENPLDPEDVEW